MAIPDEMEVEALFGVLDDGHQAFAAQREALQQILAKLNVVKKPTEQQLKSYRVAAKAARSHVVGVRSAVERLADYLDEAAERIVDWDNATAANVHEALSGMLTAYSGLKWTRRDFRPVDPIRKEISTIIYGAPKPKLLDARLRREKANVRRLLRELRRYAREREAGLWHFEGSRVVLEGAMRDLGGRSRTLMVYFIERIDRVLSHGDLMRDVWKEELVEIGAVRQAVSKLRKDLKAIGFGHVASRVRTEEGGWCFT